MLEWLHKTQQIAYHDSVREAISGKIVRMAAAPGTEMKTRPARRKNSGRCDRNPDQCDKVHFTV